METFSSIVLFALGFYILLRGAGALVSGARSLARLFGLSTWVIGVVIVGTGTSIPEFSITIASVFSGNEIGLATIIGSNTFNLLFILGLSAFLTPVLFKRRWIVRDLPLNVLAVVVAGTAILFPVIGDMPGLGITRGEGILLSVLLVAWIWYMLRQDEKDNYDEEQETLSWLVSVVFVIAGFFGVFLGGFWVVSGAEVIANIAGLSPALVGFTLVAIGTSLPELVVSLVAIMRRQTGIAVGNIIGSNIFDFLGILGITAILRPIPVVERLQFDIVATLAATLIVFGTVLLFGKGHVINRREGIVLVLLYLIYFSFLLIRE